MLYGRAGWCVYACCAGCQAAEPAKLVVLPEFALQGPPHGLPSAAWIDKACCPVPGAITEPLQDLARRRQIYIAAHQFESDAEWPGRYFNTCFLIDPDGTVILRYRRIKPRPFPRRTTSWTPTSRATARLRSFP